MARPKREEIRVQLLDAAADLIAERGDSAPTSLIAKAAGVAEGSLFTYFRTKGELLTELHDTLVTEAFASIPSGLGGLSSRRERLLVVWTGALHWALSNPTRWACLRILGLSSQVNEDLRHDSQRKGRRFMAEELGIQDSPPGFPTMVLHAIIDVTVELTQRNPELAKDYGASGFEALWRALSNE